jgi:hypothetical protein
VLEPENLLRHSVSLPEIATFPTVDELLAQFGALATEHGDLVTGRRVGTSRLGEAIPCFTVGAGSRNHLIVGGVHPNEPVGGVTALELARLLVRDDALREAFDATWHIVPCIDPDGTRLNETWFAAPQDRIGYARGFYRPAPVEQVEWSFPFAYKNHYFDAVIPETAAFMRLIDTLRPELLVSLHNSELGGAYFYLSHGVPGLPELLHRVAESVGLPLHTGEPESPNLTELATAVYGDTTTESTYDWLESVGVDPTEHIGGSSSTDYANRYGTLTVVAEAPQWSHPAADDDTLLADTYADVVREKASRLTAMADTLATTLAAARPALRWETPWLRATEAFVPLMAGLAGMESQRAETVDPQQRATVAEKFSAVDLVHCFRLRYGGMLLRAMTAEVGAGTATAPLRRLTAQFAQVYAQWEDEARAQPADPVALRRLAGLQLGTILQSAGSLVRT